MSGPRVPGVSPAHFPHGLAGVIYDCDGVMIDSREANRAFYNRVLAALGLAPMSREQEGYAFMATAGEALRRMVPQHLHGDIERAARTVDYWRDVMPLARLMPGFRAFIGRLHARGLRQAIDTNRTAEGIQRVLDFFALPPYFEPVISASCAPPKPSPAGAEQVCRAWGVQPGQMLFVGDSTNDMEAALGAGMVFAAFGPDFPADALERRGGAGLGDATAIIVAPDFAALAAELGVEPAARPDAKPDAGPDAKPAR